MDQALTQLLATQLGITGDVSNYQPQDLATLVANQTSNPWMAALLTQMKDRQAAAVTEEPEAAEAAYEQELARLKKIIARLKQELASADVMARYIAGIFGTCPHCWGLNRLCPHCGGRGQPGYVEPNYGELRAWVEPALKRGGLAIAKAEKP
jgi:hypothetical protein